MAKQILYGVGKSILRSITDPTDILALSKLANVSVESTGNEDEIFGGDSPYAFASFPTDKAINVSAENATFDIKMLSFTQGAKITTGAVTMHDLMSVAIPEDLSIVLNEGATNVVVLGYTLAESAEALAAGEYFYDEAANTVTFADADIGDEVDIVFEYESSADAQTASNTEDAFAKPFTFIHRIPVYNDESVLVGQGQLIVYRAKANNSFTFDFERQTAFAPNIELRAMDAKRADGKLWDFTIDPIK